MVFKSERDRGNVQHKFRTITPFCYQLLSFYISFVSLLQKNYEHEKYKRLLIAGMVMSMAFFDAETPGDYLKRNTK